MELELLDQILTSDEPLHLAWLVFDVENNPANLDRARHAIQMQVKEGLLQVLVKDNSGERIIESWEIQQALGNEQNWLTPHTEATYFLRITDEGAKLV